MSASDKSPSRRQSDPEQILQLRAARVWLSSIIDHIGIDPEATAMLFPADRLHDEGCEVEITFARRGAAPNTAGDMGGRRVTLAHSLSQIDACLEEAAGG